MFVARENFGHFHMMNLRHRIVPNPAEQRWIKFIAEILPNFPEKVCGTDGWGLHPLESAAFLRHKPVPDIVYSIIIALAVAMNAASSARKGA
jgi:hypothetical protein